MSGGELDFLWREGLTGCCGLEVLFVLFIAPLLAILTWWTGLLLLLLHSPIKNN